MADLPPSGPSAGSRRFWITVAIFALLNIAAWFAYHAWQQSHAPRRDILAIQSFSPGDGELIADNRPAVLTWTFNLDVGKTGPAAPGPDGQPPAAITPAVAGQWLWTDPRTLTFESHDNLPRATKFIATLNPAALRTTDGFTLPKPIAETFQTQALTLDSVKQASFDGQNRILLELAFNDKVIPAEVMRYLKIEGPDGKPVAATLNGQGAGPIVRVLTDPIPFVDKVIPLPTPVPVTTTNTASHKHGTTTTPPPPPNTLRVTILPGLTGASGPLGIATPEQREVRIANQLLADTLGATIGSAGPAALTLTFNSPVTEQMFEKIKPLISVQPPLDCTLDLLGGGNGGGNQIHFTGPFGPATRYTVTIAKVGAADDVRKYPRPATLSVFVPDRDATAYFTHTTGYLGTDGNRTVLIKAVNVPAIYVSAQRVYENNLVAWRNAAIGWDANTQDFAHPAGVKHYILANKKNVTQDVRVDLADLLKSGGGATPIDGVYSLAIDIDTTGSDRGESVAQYTRQHPYQNYGSSTALITLSDTGLTAKVMASPTNPATEKALLAWAVSLSTGKPLPNVAVRVYSNKNQLLGEAQTNADGLARIDHINPAPGESPTILIAQAKSVDGKDGSLTWLDLNNSQRDESAFDTNGRPYLRQGCEAFVWPERGVYRPGETVTLRAIVRGINMSVPHAGLPVRWQIRRPDGRDWQSKIVNLDADGGAEWRVTFPADVPTGYWSAQLGLPGDRGAGSSGMTVFGSADFQIEDFMPDRMKVALTLSGPGLEKNAAGRWSLAKGPMNADVQADYLFGQPAANLAANLTVHYARAAFSAKNFPAVQGWLTGDTAQAGDVFIGQSTGTDQLSPMSQTLDKNGHARFEVDLQKKLAAAITKKDAPDAEPTAHDLYQFRGPWRLALTANAVEIGGRAVTAYGSAQADILPAYLMVRQTGNESRDYASIGKTVHYEAAMVTPAGDKLPQDTSLRVRIFRETWINTLVLTSGKYHYQSSRNLEPLKQPNDAPPTQITLTQGAGSWNWTPTDPGDYILEFADLHTRQATTLRLTVGGEGGWTDSVSRENPERLEVSLAAADAPSSQSPAETKTPTFKIGQSVKAIIKSPFPGQLLLTVETDTVLLSKVVDMTTTAAEVDFVLPEGARPNGYVGATVIRKIEPDRPWGAHRAFGLARFHVDSSDRRLTVTLKTPHEIRPTQSLDIAVAVTDSTGHPVKNAAVALAAVDEGILRVTDYRTPNPLAFYNGTCALGVVTSDLYDLLMPEVARPDGQSKVGGDEDDDAAFSRRHTTPVSAKRVKTVSLVADIVHTDAAGNVILHLPTPEFLGQLRVMAVAYAGPLVGSSDSAVLVRSPLVVQSSYPRFLAPGDTADASLLFINNSHDAGTVHTTLHGDNDAVLQVASAIPDISLAPGEQKVLTVKLSAQAAAGICHLALESKLDDNTYTEHVEIPVRPASPTISLGNYATVTPDKPAQLDIPAGMLSGTTSFQLSVTQRPSLGILTGLEYLNRYPYGCCEQVTSQSFPLVYLGDIGKEVAPGMFDEAAITRKVQSGIIRLIGMQTAGGGLSMWPGSTEVWPWGSVYAAHFLVEAQNAGQNVPDDFKARLFAYVHSILLKSAQPGPETDLQAYAAYVMALAGKPDRAVMSRLGELVDAQQKLSPGSDSTARFHLALAWAAAGRTDLAEKLLPDSLPLPTTRRQLGGNLASPVRDQALMLMTLLTVSPHNSAIAPLVERLAAAGQRHEWYSTQDNGFAIMAMGKYLRATQDEKPFTSAELLDGNKVLAQSDASHPLVWNASADVPAHLTVRIKGEAGATGHISWLQNGVPLKMPVPADHALKLRRTYLTEDGKLLDLTAIPSGTAIRVEVTVETAQPLSNLVIEDLLPAGLEIENPRLTTSLKSDQSADNANPPVDMNQDRLDVRDDRIVVVGSVTPGLSRFSYLARAVTPGTYIIPPVRGECMYDPGISSLSGGGAHMTIVSNTRKELASR